MAKPAGQPSGQPATARTPSFPRRDADGRIPNLAEMLGGVAFAIILGVIVLVVIDGIVTLLGRGGFGSFSGWVAGVLAVWMFVEDFRAYRDVPARFGVTLIAAALALVAGIAVNFAVAGLPRVFSGAISVTVAAVVYAVIWFFGIRSFAGRLGER